MLLQEGLEFAREMRAKKIVVGLSYGVGVRADSVGELALSPDDWDAVTCISFIGGNRWVDLTCSHGEVISHNEYQKELYPF